MNSIKMLAVMCLLLGACERVDVGNVGLKINTAGDVRGVENSPTVSGWVWYNPFTQDVIEFSTIVQKWDGKLPMIGDGAQTLVDLRTFGAK